MNPNFGFAPNDHVEIPHQLGANVLDKTNRRLGHLLNQRRRQQMRRARKIQRASEVVV